MCVSFEGLGQLPSALLDLLVYSIFHSPVLPLTPVGSQNSYQRCGKKSPGCACNDKTRDFKVPTAGTQEPL